MAGRGSQTPAPLTFHLQSSQNRILIKNGKVVNADGIQDLEIFIEQGTIKEMGRNLIVPGGGRVIDARGKYVMPGGIDPNTHFQLPASADDFYTGTRAAIAGGTTTIIDCAIPAKGQSLVAAYNQWRERADEKVACDYALNVAVTWWSESVEAEMEELSKNHGINSFKTSMALKDVAQLNDTELYEAFEKCKQLGAIAQVHAENGDIIAKNRQKLLAAGITGPEGHEMSRPEEVEAEAIYRACVVANQMDCPLYVVHVMSRSAADVIAAKRREGVVVYGEPVAASLAIDGTNYQHKSYRHAAAHVTGPPLRPDTTTPEYLMDLLANDDLQVSATNHCTFSSAQKELGKDDFTKIPDGVNGVEERMALIWQKGVVAGKMDPTRFVAVTSTNAAKIFNLYPLKGCLAVGSDADIVIWDPNMTQTISATTHHSTCDFNIFEGINIRGGPEYVIANGRLAVDDGQLKAVQGYGKFLPAPTFSPFVYEAVAQREKEKKKQLEIIKNRPVTLNITAPSLPLSPTSNPDDDMQTPPEVAVPANLTNRKEHLTRGPTSSGGRHMQDTTFSLSADYPNPADSSNENRSTIRVKAPPGGQSSGLW